MADSNETNRPGAVHIHCSKSPTCTSPCSCRYCTNCCIVSLSSFGPCNTRTDHAGQFFPAHVEQHANGAGNQGCQHHPKARKENKRRADVLFLTRRTTPLDRLLCAVFVHPRHCCATAAFEAVGMCLVARAVPGAGIGRVLACRFGGKAFWDDRGESKVLTGIGRGGGRRRAVGRQIQRCLFDLFGCPHFVLMRLLS